MKSPLSNVCFLYLRNRSEIKLFLGLPFVGWMEHNLRAFPERHLFQSCVFMHSQTKLLACASAAFLLLNEPACQGILFMACFRVAKYLASDMFRTFFLGNMVYKGKLAVRMFADAQVALAKIEGRPRLRCALKKAHKKNTLKLSVSGNAVCLDNLQHPAQSSLRAQLTACVKPGGKSPFFSVLPCSFCSGIEDVARIPGVVMQ